MRKKKSPDIVFTDCAIGGFFERALARGDVYAAAGVINLAKIRYATKISAFYVAHKIVLAASLVPSYCKTRRM